MTISDKKWCIRHKPTGNYLPERYHWGAVHCPRGYTNDEPEPAHERDPRVFLSYQSAAQALAAWSKGKFKRSHGQDHNGEYYEDLDIISVPGRNKEEFEIIEFKAVNKGSRFWNAGLWMKQQVKKWEDNLKKKHNNNDTDTFQFMMEEE